MSTNGVKCQYNSRPSIHYWEHRSLCASFSNYADSRATSLVRKITEFQFYKPGKFNSAADALSLRSSTALYSFFVASVQFIFYKHFYRRSVYLQDLRLYSFWYLNSTTHIKYHFDSFWLPWILCFWWAYILVFYQHKNILPTA